MALTNARHSRWRANVPASDRRRAIPLPDRRALFVWSQILGRFRAELTEQGFSQKEAYGLCSVLFAAEIRHTVTAEILRADLDHGGDIE